MILDQAKNYFLDRIGELNQLSHDKNYVNPWIFVCASAFIDYLAKIVSGADRGRTGYKDFIKDYLSRINSNYKNFTYNDGKKDLPDQMYHVLRCGILHSFSFIPDSRSRRSGGRDRSIVLCHSDERDRKGWRHLMFFPPSGYTGPTIVTDAALFVAEDFIDDLEKVVNLIFADASTNATLSVNIETWTSNHPPIMGNV